ncbi:nuclear RNA export factor 2 [Oryctolagus cuniculus]|uniref:nuclear RNA export factor 2 n=1 Tax=Oryctolagus cuniculus TaxID=9986 RepID=UPI0003904AC5|nr:nuclear RNA export factor 2 [Oryctolagus cuniculus]
MLPRKDSKLKASNSKVVLQNTESEKQQQEHAVPSMKYENHENKEHNDDASSPDAGRNVESSFQDTVGDGNVHDKHSRYEHLPSYLNDDGNTAVRNVHRDSQRRCTPYDVRRNKRTVQWRYDDQIHITVWREKKSLERQNNKDTKDEATDIWFKVMVPYGKNYDKKWLMNSIQSHCAIPFTPVDFHYVKNQARFFVQDASTAAALAEVSHKICDNEDKKIPIFVSRSVVPYSVQNKLQPEQMEQLKLALSKRYDAFQRSLDLQRLRFDRDLVSHNIDMILNRRNCMAATLEVIQSDFSELVSLNLSSNKLYQLNGLCDIVEKAPKVKILNLSANKLRTAWELEKVKELDLEELWLEGNPLCRTFPSHAAYVSAIRDCFPKLLRLDGIVLPLPVGVDTNELQLVEPFPEPPKETEMLKSLILRFLQEYYFIYDYGDRRSLLRTYHEKACFSLTIPFDPMDPVPSGLCEYFKDSRNMMYLQDPYLRRQMLKHTNWDIVNTLNVLPRTQHDFISFSMDMWFQMGTALCFSVNGVFKGGSNSWDSAFIFTRIFITAPRSSSSLCILNDQLFVRDVMPVIHNSSVLGAIPGSNTMADLNQLQQKMVQAFYMQSGMKLEWSQKCLEDNGWNYIRAKNIFITLLTQSKIPQEAFRHMP